MDNYPGSYNGPKPECDFPSFRYKTQESLTPGVCEIVSMYTSDMDSCPCSIHHTDCRATITGKGAVPHWNEFLYHSENFAWWEVRPVININQVVNTQ